VNPFMIRYSSFVNLRFPHLYFGGA
jgi:hypothetical protein